ncbi:MAG TPA: glycosyltransferase family 4 protein [Baekduia sp.]|nr:glycosyltransferase family 4 protein [Baekduia sp.]
MILFLHNKYRTPGGEERVVQELRRIVTEQLGEPSQVLLRDSDELTGARAAAGMLRGGLSPEAIDGLIRAQGARVVHAHNLLPAFGWRALAAARAAGARTVLSLHNYRLVCAVGTCIDSSGVDCTRCHGRDTAPGLLQNCRDGRAEAAVYAASLALWQRRMIANADAVVVPSKAALHRLRELGAPLPEEVAIIPHPVRRFAPRSFAHTGTYALITSRLAREKDIATAIEASRIAGIELVIAGGGPLAATLREQAGAHVRFVGRVSDGELDGLRAGACVALSPSLAHETFGLAAVEAMAAGLPVVASDSGALAELEAVELVPPADAVAMASAISRVAGDRKAGDRAIAAARALAAPERVAERLASVYR